MPRMEQFQERIGAVFLPEPDVVASGGDPALAAEGLQPGAVPPVPVPGLPVPGLPGEAGPPGQPVPMLPTVRFCRTSLKQGCYTLSLVPHGVSIFGTRFRGTLRVEQVANGLRFSGDLYRHRLLDVVLPDPQPPVLRRGPQLLGEAGPPSDEAADTGGTIPVYSRRSYHSYLRGTGAQLISLVPPGSPCTFTLELEEFVYNQPATGFSGSFNPTATRSIRFVLVQTLPDLIVGSAFQGTTNLGMVSMRWVSPRFRHAHVQINTLQGAAPPPADVGGWSIATIFGDIGWHLTVTHGGTIPLPAALSHVDVHECWGESDLHALMASVPGYDPADLDSVWRVHLVAVPAGLFQPPDQCGRGVMFDSSLGADPNAVAREGSATFSDDGYPFNEALDGAGGSHYDAAANQQQRNVPRAFLRSATHEVGHAFNQIHQNFEGGIDNSIMTPTNGVARVIGTSGTFPDQINLAFNDRVTRHLRHLPDPAVRPGAMDFFGSAIAAPEAADVAWPEMLDLSVEPSSDRVALGEPITLSWTLANRGQAPVLVPSELDVESLVVRVNVTDPTGKITFMRPANVKSCPRIVIVPLEPGATLTGSTRLFWGRDGFAFETPGRHVVEAIILWELAGVPVAVSGRRDVFVSFPTSDAENRVAALLLDPEVGAAVAVGNPGLYEGAAERIREAQETAAEHPANEALRGLLDDH
jgi:hypothetical protein